MDALQKAISEIEVAQNLYELSEDRGGNAFYRSQSDVAYQHAAIYAAVAQAEQLKRIADAMQWRNNLLHREFQLFEASAEAEE